MDSKLKKALLKSGINPEKLKSNVELNEIASGKKILRREKNSSKNVEYRILGKTKRKVNESGGGINANINGEFFERVLSLYDNLISNGYVITSEGYIMKNNKCFGVYLKKTKLHKYLLEKYNIKSTDIHSHKLYPDECIISNNKVYIFELKNQTLAGSVDEKIQTGPYKLYYYEQLFEGLKFDGVEFIFIMNDYFKQKKFDSVHEYLEKNNIYQYYNTIPLEHIGL